MRVESLNLPQAAHSHSKVHGSGKAFPGTPAEKANEAATSKLPGAENVAASGTTDAEQAAKSAPQGLTNAISRLEAKQNSTHGIEQALEMLTRNLSRYQLTPPPADTGSTAPTTDGSTASSTETAASETASSDSTTGNQTSTTA